MILLTSFPCGADYTVCPKCDNMFDDFKMGEDPDSEIKYYDYTGDKNLNINSFYFCKKCEFVFKDSHVYHENGCTESIYFIEYVTKYKVNGEIIQSNIKKEHFSSKIEILETKCSCNGLVSGPNGSYPYSKFPQYYFDKCKQVYTYGTSN